MVFTPNRSLALPFFFRTREYFCGFLAISPVSHLLFVKNNAYMHIYTRALFQIFEFYFGFCKLKTLKYLIFYRVTKRNRGSRSLKNRQQSENRLWHETSQLWRHCSITWQNHISHTNWTVWPKIHTSMIMKLLQFLYMKDLTQSLEIDQNVL